MNEQDIYLTNDRFARHTGIELTEVKPGYAKAKMQIKDFHLNAINIVQGGAVFTLADYTFAAASNAYGRTTVSINANISYMKANTGSIIYAECTELSKNYRTGNYRVEITDENGTLTAIFNSIAYFKSK